MKRIAVFIAASLAVGTLGIARPSNAGVQRSGDFAYVAVSKTVDGRKQVGKVAASCPRGMEPTGVGGAVMAKDGFLTLATLADGGDADDLAGDKGVVAARWTKQRADVRLKAYLVCIGHDAPQAYNRATDDGDVGFVATGCPGGHVLIGGGGGFPDRDGELRGLSKLSAQPSWFAAGEDLDDDALLEVVAACHPDAARPITYPTTPNVSPDASVETTQESICNGGVLSAGGLSSSARVLASRPVDDEEDPDKVPDDGWSVTVLTDQAGTQLNVTAVCVNDPI